MYAGVKIIEDASLVDAVGLDWSGCRSKARAKRRSKYGHRQRVKTAYAPKMQAFSIDGGRTFVMHPAMARELREKMAPAPAMSDWARQMFRERAEAGIFPQVLPEGDKVVKTEGVA